MLQQYHSCGFRLPISNVQIAQNFFCFVVYPHCCTIIDGFSRNTTILDHIEKGIDEYFLGLNSMTVCNKWLGSNAELCRTDTIMNCRHIRKHSVSGNGFISGDNIACRISQCASRAKQGWMSMFVELCGVLEGVLDGVNVEPSKLWLEIKVVDRDLFCCSCFNNRIDEV